MRNKYYKWKQMIIFIQVKEKEHMGIIWVNKCNESKEGDWEI